MAVVNPDVEFPPMNFSSYKTVPVLLKLYVPPVGPATEKTHRTLQSSDAVKVFVGLLLNSECPVVLHDSPASLKGGIATIVESFFPDS